MNTLLRVLVVALLATCVTPGHAAAPGHAANAPRPVGPTQVVLPPMDPMAIEMQREIERSQKEYGALFQRLAAARSEQEAFDVQEEMQQQRVALQIGLLRIQAAYARRAGRERLAAQLERSIAELVAPPAPAPAGADAPGGSRL